MASGRYLVLRDHTNDEMEGITMSSNTRVRRSVRTIALLLLSLTLVSGCASKGQLRESIKTVSINKEVKVANNLLYSGALQRRMTLIPGAGVGVANATARDPGAQLKAAMVEAQIDIGEILREQFQTELVKTSVFPSFATEGGDAEVRLEVSSLGFFTPHEYTTKLRFCVSVIGRLVRRDGTVLWRRKEHSTEKEGQVPTHYFNEYIQNPQLIREACTAAMKVVITKLVKDMRR